MSSSSEGKVIGAVSPLEQDNASLRQKLHDLREEKSNLIAENHGLVSEVEEASYILHKTMGQQQLLEDVVEKCRGQVKGLGNALADSKQYVELKDREIIDWKERYKSCRKQLMESDELIQRQTETIIMLKQQLMDLSQLTSSAEAGYDAAKTKANEIGQSFASFQSQLEERLHCIESQLNDSYGEREQLLADLLRHCAEIEDLQKETERLQTQSATEKNLRLSVEKQNSDLFSQLKLYLAKIKKIDFELRGCQLVKEENIKLKATIKETSSKLKAYEAEIKENRLQLNELEFLTQTLQRSTTTTKRTQESNSAAVNLNSFVCSERKQTENEQTIQTLRLEIAKLTQELKENSNVLNKGSASVLLNGERYREGENQHQGFLGQDRADELEAIIQRLENERQQLMSVISSLERKVSDTEVVTVSLDAQLLQRSSQVAELQKSMHELTVRETMNEREMRKQLLLVAALEKQLDNKVAELATHITKEAELEDSMQKKSKELRTLKEDIDDRVREVTGKNEAIKQLNEKQNKESRLQLEMMERKYKETKLQMDQTEKRSLSMQQTLSEMNMIMSTLRQKLLLSAQKLEAMKETSDRKIQQLELELRQTREDLQSEKQHGMKFDQTVKQVSHLEEEMQKLMERSEEKTDQVETLETELKEKQTLLLESMTKLEELEYLHNALKREKEQKEQDLCKETSNLKILLENSQKKLNITTKDVERREQQVRDLTNTIRDLQFEKKKVIDDLGNELKDTLKQLKHEKREKDRQETYLVHQNNEIKSLSDQLQKMEVLMEELQDQLSNCEMELHDKSQIIKELFTECEQLTTKLIENDLKLSECAGIIEGRNAELQRCKEQLELLKQEMKQNLDKLCSKCQELNELKQKLEERQGDLHRRTAQTDQQDAAVKERLTESEKHIIQLEEVLKNYQIEAYQHGKHTNDLTEEVRNLTKALKEKCHVLNESEIVIGRLKVELDTEKERSCAQRKTIDVMHVDRRNMELANKRMEEDMQRSCDSLRQLQEKLDHSEQKLMTTEAEFDRSTKELVDTKKSLQTRKLELETVHHTLSKVEEERTVLKEQLKHTEKEYKILNEQQSKELLTLRDSHVVANLEGEKEALQLSLKDAKAREEMVKKELKSLTHQISSLQMELDAIRLIANTTKETSLIKDAEITRLKGRINSLIRSELNAADLKIGSMHEPIHFRIIEDGKKFISNELGVLFTEPADCFPDKAKSNEITKSCEFNSSPNFGHSALTTSCLLIPTEGQVAPSSSGCDSRKQNIVPVVEVPRSSKRKLYKGMESDDPDSLELMWKQLQDEQNHLFSGSSSLLNFDGRITSFQLTSKMSSATTSTGLSDPKRTASTQLNDSKEEKLRIQNRIKALIGYKDPVGKTSSKEFSRSSDVGTNRCVRNKVKIRLALGGYD